MPVPIDLPASSTQERRRPLRTLAPASAAILLAVSAYQATFAANRLGANVIHPDGYGGGNANGDDDDGGLSDGAAAGIAIGVVAIGAGVYYADRKQKEKEENQAAPSSKAKGSDAATLPALPAGAKVVELRLTPARTDLAAGSSRVFDLQARSKSDGKWYSVAARPEATVRLKSGPPLRPVDGTKNVFSVPLDAPPSSDGQKSEVTGTFTQADGTTLSTTAGVNLRVQAVGR
jgi:hypothetical protein